MQTMKLIVIAFNDMQHFVPYVRYTYLKLVLSNDGCVSLNLRGLPSKVSV